MTIATFDFLHATARGRDIRVQAGEPGFAEALLAAWPRPAAILDEDGRLLAWNRDFALRVEPEALWRGCLLSRQHLVTRSLEGGLSLVEWNPEEAAMSEARRLCHEEMLAKLAQLDALSGRPDLRAMRAEAHAIRGLAANFGLLTLLPASQALEEACRAGDEAGAADALDQLRKEAGPALQEFAAQMG